MSRGASFKAFAFGTAALQAFTTDQIVALETQDLAALTMTQSTAFTGSQISAMTAEQIDSLLATSPIVLDLDGNGVSTLAASAGVHFDINATGNAYHRQFHADKPKYGLRRGFDPTRRTVKRVASSGRCANLGTSMG